MPAFHCTLVTPTDQLLDAEVTSVVLPAYDGEMGIEAGHAPMLVQLGYGLMRAKAAGGETKYVIGGGFAQIKDNRLTVLTDEARKPSDITKAEAQAAQSEAAALPGTSEGEAMQKQRASQRAAALARHAG